MPGCHTHHIIRSVGGVDYRLRVLTDRQQYADPDGHAARLGISEAQWSLFGQCWPAGHRLAHAMHRFDVAGKRILELGCGIGLASLVLQRRGADIVASDAHPLAEPFLCYNAALNGLPAVHYRQLLWDHPLPTLGTFDAIVASDVLYERGQAERLCAVIARHARATAEVLLVDPGRGHAARFGRLLADDGFVLQSAGHASDEGDPLSVREKLLHFRRQDGVQ